VVENKAQVYCQCEEGRCFLEEDAEWIARNGQLASGVNNHFNRNELLQQLDIDRMQAKEIWMNSLQIQGTCQVCCRRQLKNIP